MTEPRRLLHALGAENELELELLRSAIDETPPAGAMLNAATALGIGSAMAAGLIGGSAPAALSVGASQSGVGAALASGAAAGAKGVGAGTGLAALPITAGALMKQIAIGAAVGLATASGVQLAYESASAPRDPQRSAPAVGVPEPRASRGEAPAARGSIHAAQNDSATPEQLASATRRASEALPSQDKKTPVGAPREPAARADARVARPAQATLPSAEPTAGTAAIAAPPTAAFATSAVNAAPSAPAPKSALEMNASIAGEVALLDRARRALAAGDAERALGVLDEYGRAPRSGILGPETLLLRIQALLQLGQREAAVALARRFVAQNPGSRHAESLRSLLESPAPR